jgi:phosphatidylglycerophosphatase A
MNQLVLLIASAGFIGYIPIASGTFGSLVGIPLFFATAPLSTSPVLYLTLFIAAVGVACWAAGRADHLLAEQDSSKIVIDEVVGYLAATLFLEPTWTTVWIAFVIFRVFDMIKPFPANYADRELHGGVGVVLDDVISGLYANLATRLVLAFL